jgi:LmbE family N-acetylglucosaminyl deacetylase
VTSVLVVGAHPDDEAVGCGGALLCHARARDAIRAVFLTSGEAGGHGIENAGAIREHEALVASRILGIGDLQFWREPDGRLRARRALVARVRAALAETHADVVYAPHPRDDHPDHRAAARIVREALGGARSRAELWHYEIWSPLSQIDHVVDISDVLEDKLRAISAYESQCAVMRFDDAFRGLARYRGEMHSWPGGPYAEVFTSGNGA